MSTQTVFLRVPNIRDNPMNHNVRSLKCLLILTLCVNALSACGGIQRKVPPPVEPISTNEPVNPADEIVPQEKETEHPMPFPPVSPNPPGLEPPSIQPDVQPPSSLQLPPDAPAMPREVITPPDLGRRPPALIYSDALKLYWSPSTAYDIYFQDVYWYVRSDDHWFRSRSHRGPWELIQPFQLPESLR